VARAVRDLPGAAPIVAGAKTPARLAELVAAANEPPLERLPRQAAYAIGGEIPLEVASPQFWPARAR